jgi:uncharacterized membrane protein
MPRQDLTTPRQRRRLGAHYDPDAFGRFSEGVARFIGTARFLIYQTVLCTFWVVWNVAVPKHFRFDEYPFQFLTLVLSLQAAYAAPLILLAQNRQEERDRAFADIDREINARTQADTEFLAREIAGVRLSLADVPTTDDIRDPLEKLAAAVRDLSTRIDEITAPAAPAPRRAVRG